MPSKSLTIAALTVCAVAMAAVFGFDAVIHHGEKSFSQLGCASCHANGGGPNLKNVRDKYDAATMVRFIRDPEVVYRERGRKPLNPGYVGMHKVKASDWEIRSIAMYLKNVSD